MKHVVMFSGGAASYAAAFRAKVRHGRENIELLFADTIIEDDDTYRHLIETAALLAGMSVRDVSELSAACLALPDLWDMTARKTALAAIREEAQARIPLLHWTADGRNPFEVFRDARFLGNNRIDPCSRVLKRELCRKWTETHYAPTEAIVHVGLDWTEVHRVKRTVQGWQPWRVRALMCARPYVSKQNTLEHLERRGVKTQRLYALGFPHANCGGGCVKAGIAQWVHLLKVMPDRYRWWETQEQELRDFLGKDVAILRDRSSRAKCTTCKGAGMVAQAACEDCEGTGKATRPLTLRELRENAALQVDLFDWGGCGCFVGEGDPDDLLPKLEARA